MSPVATSKSLAKDDMNKVDSSMASKSDNNTYNILFNYSKDELFTLTSGYKKFQRELKNWKIATNRDEITYEKLSQCKIFITVGPQKKFTAGEFEALKKFMQNNGSIFILMSEGGESKLDTNLNYFLEQFGIVVNNDSVIRTTYFKYFNPIKKIQFLN